MPINQCIKYKRQLHYADYSGPLGWVYFVFRIRIQSLYWSCGKLGLFLFCDVSGVYTQPAPAYSCNNKLLLHFDQLQYLIDLECARDFRSPRVVACFAELVIHHFLIFLRWRTSQRFWLLPRMVASFVGMLLLYEILRDSNVVLLVKLNLNVFHTVEMKRCSLAPAQNVLQQQIHTKISLQIYKSAKSRIWLL